MKVVVKTTCFVNKTRCYKGDVIEISDADFSEDIFKKVEEKAPGEAKEETKSEDKKKPSVNKSVI